MSTALEREQNIPKIVGYNHDLCQWSEQQAQFLENHQWDKLDIHNLVDEILDVTRRDHRALLSYFIVLLTHLLKCKYQPQMFSTSWISSIGNSRNEIEFLLEDSPSLKNRIRDNAWRQKAWKKAVMKASVETGLNEEIFPKEPIWSNEEILEERWYPQEIESQLKQRRHK